MMTSNTRHSRPGDYNADADVPDEYVWSAISYLDPEQKNEPSDSALWFAAVAALVIWGSLWIVLHSL